MRIPIKSFSLPNGLRVNLSEDHTAPIVAVNLWYHVGSANEREGRTGFAHLFEHMLFQGSENVGTNEHFELIQRAGGTLNGSTWLDRTNYFETVPSNQLALALWLEADRMGNLLPAMTQEKLDTQREVVKNERRWTVDNQPYGTWWEKLPALAFPVEHPFHHSLIGSMEDLTAASVDDVKEFFRTWYTPANCVLSVTGDFDPQFAIDRINEYFGNIDRGAPTPPLRDMSVEPRFAAPVRQVVQDKVALPRIFIAFRTPTLGTDTHFASAITAAILGSGRGSRLHQALVREQQVAAAAGAFTFDLAKGSDLLVVDATARDNTDARQLEEATHTLLDALQSNPITESELQRAKALVQTGFVDAMQSASDRADKLSMYTTYLNDPERINSEVDRFNALTTEDVNQFVGDYLTEMNRATLFYVPQEGE